MLALLLLSGIPVVIAAALHSPGLGFMTAAGLLWTSALWVASAAPVVPGANGPPINEDVALTLSVAAAATAVTGVSAVVVALL